MPNTVQDGDGLQFDGQMLEDWLNITQSNDIAREKAEQAAALLDHEGDDGGDPLSESEYR